MKRRHPILLLCIVVISWLCNPSPCLFAQQDAVDGYREQQLEGWTLKISKQLLEQQQTDTERAIEMLAKQLQQIRQVLPAKAVLELQKVPLWLNPEYSGVPPRAEYHPGAEWLRDNKRDPNMVKGVEFTNVRIFEIETKRMPNFALHELSHAFHDRVVKDGFGNSEIEAAFDKAKAAGTYERVEQRFGDGRSAQVRAYALSSPMEYFAECTEAYFSTNDFYPFTRVQLAKHDPTMFALLKSVWGD
jgi:hypothetical protein